MGQVVGKLTPRANLGQLRDDFASQTKNAEKGVPG